jgi:hypothetical protein
MAVLDDAKAYVTLAFGTSYRTWEALSDTEKQRTLVSAGRYLDQQAWQGTATGVQLASSTMTSWPRSGVTVNGAELSSATTPTDMINGYIEMAVVLASDDTADDVIDQGSNISSVAGGGGVSVSFAFPTSARQGTATVMPVVVQRLTAKYLATPASASEGGYSQSGNCTSQFAACNQFNLVDPE